MIELKPCPFCGYPAHWVNGVSEDLGFIICENCHAKIEGYIDECYEKWNRRYLNGMPITLYTMIPGDEELHPSFWERAATPGKTWVIGPDTRKGVDMKKINEEMWKELEGYEKGEKDDRTETVSVL